MSGDRSPRLKRVVASAAAALSLAVPLAGAAGAQSVIDPANPCPPGVPAPAAPFTDRNTAGQVHLINIDCAAAWRIVLGGAGGVPGRYAPTAPVRRDQMASFIFRALELPAADGDSRGYDLPSSGSQFPDVPANNPHAAAIRSLRAAGIVLGKGDGAYGPGDMIRRDQMASFLVRAAEFAYGDSPGGLAANASAPFTDVAANNTHKPRIDAAYELFGLVQGTNPTRYGPADSTRRDQMATFVVRLIDITQLDPFVQG